MKKIVFTLVLLMSVICGAMAQNNAMYVYRNDGEFNAFIKSEVDSMVCSHFDADSIYHKEWQMQVVYTADSIYRIPLEVIDSISFVTPAPVINKDVFQLTAEHDPYLSDCDTLRFTMSLSTPSELQPGKGNIVVSAYDCLSFPDGIMAKVVSVAKDENGIHYNCERVGIESVFDKLIFTGYGYIDSPDGNAKPHVSRAPHSFTKIFWDEEWTKELSYSGTSTNITANDKAYAKFTVDIEIGKPSYFSVELTNELKTSIQFNATNSFAKWYEKQLGSINLGRIPLPYTLGLLWITPKLNLSAYFAEEAKLSLDYQAHYNRTDKVTFTFAESQWKVDYAPINDLGIDVASLSMDGYMEVGLIPDVLMAFNGSATGIGFEAKAGVKETIHFKFDALEYFDEGAYSALKDSYAKTTIPQEVKAYAQIGLFDVGERPFSGTIYNKEPQWGTNKYLLPLFDKPEYKEGATPTTAIIKSDISRDLLLPVNVGIIYYEGDTKLNTDYKSITYQKEKKWTLNGLESSFSKMEPGKTYTAYPIVKIMGKELRAVPSCDFPKLHSCPDNNHPHAIDLGLPSGTKWCCMNVGASSPEQYGGYYAWGETSEKSEYSWTTYAYLDSRFFDCQYIGSDIAGSTYDVAHVRMGAPWKMPSHGQQMELKDNCTWTWTHQNGVYGILFTGKNGGHIFLPAAGCRNNGSLLSAGSFSSYWSSSLSSSYPNYAYYLHFNSSNVGWYYVDRYYGLSVRAVCQ